MFGPLPDFSPPTAEVTFFLIEPLDLASVGLLAAFATAGFDRSGTASFAFSAVGRFFPAVSFFSETSFFGPTDPPTCGPFFSLVTWALGLVAALAEFALEVTGLLTALDFVAPPD